MSEPERFGRVSHRSEHSNFECTSLPARSLNMYRSGKHIRDRDGKIIGGTYLARGQAGNSDLTADSGRVQPDRRWFGNTRVVGQGELDTFRDEMKKRLNDPYTMVLRTKTLPMGLLTDSDKGAKLNLLSAESFKDTFGKHKKRKRPKLSEHVTDLASLKTDASSLQTTFVTKRMPGTFAGAGTAVDTAGAAQDAAMAAAGKKGAIAAAALSSDLELAWDSMAVGRADASVAVRHWAFDAGQSRRIWAELYKVLDCSDVVLQVLDARDPVGTRSYRVENHLRTNAKHKQLVFILNKCDLVPTWAVKKWVAILSREAPTLAFHASMTNPFGKGNLIALLRQFSTAHEDKRQISVGLIGYPNVGKSSVINALKAKKVCKVAPVPGETKVWQYITLMRSVFLVDCPGVVIPSGDSEADMVLKGVVRSERLDSPEDYIPELMRRVRPEFITRLYNVPAERFYTYEGDAAAAKEAAAAEKQAEEDASAGAAAADAQKAGPAGAQQGSHGDEEAVIAPGSASARALAALLAAHPSAAGAYADMDLAGEAEAAAQAAELPVAPSMTQPKNSGRGLRHAQGAEHHGGYAGRWQIRLEPGETFDGSHYLPLGRKVVKVDHMGLLEAVAYRLGKLRKGGDPDTLITARNILNDFQRGKLPAYVRPPEKPVAKRDAGAAAASMVADMPQDAAALEEEAAQLTAAAAAAGAQEAAEGDATPEEAAATAASASAAVAVAVGGRKRGRGRTHEEAVAVKAAKKLARKADRFASAPAAMPNSDDDFDDLDM